MVVRFLQRHPTGSPTTPSPGNPNQSNNGYSFQMSFGTPNTTHYSIKSAGPHQAASAFMPTLAPGRGVQPRNGGYQYASFTFGSYFTENSPSFVQMNMGGRIKGVGLQPYFNKDMIGTTGWFSGGANSPLVNNSPLGGSKSTTRQNVFYTNFANKTSIMVGTAGPAHHGLTESHKAASPTHVYWMRGAQYPSTNNFSNTFWKMSKQHQIETVGNPSVSSYPTKFILQPVSSIPSNRVGTPYSEDTNGRIYVWNISSWQTTPYLSDTSFTSGGNYASQYNAPGDFSWNHGQAASSKTYAKLFVGSGPAHKYYPGNSNGLREQTVQFPYAAFPYGNSYSVPQADMGQSLVPQTGSGSSNRGPQGTYGGHAATSSASSGYVWGGWSANSGCPNTISAVIGKVRVYPHATADGEATTLGDTNYVGHYGGKVSSGGDAYQAMYHIGSPTLAITPNTYPLNFSSETEKTFVFPYASFTSVTAFNSYQPSLSFYPNYLRSGYYSGSYGHANT